MCLFLCCDEDCKIPKCKDIPIKRYFLPLIGIFALSALPELQNFVYLPLIITFGFLILFWNFPWIVYYTASKPLYYQDLFIDEKKLPNSFYITLLSFVVFITVSKFLDFFLGIALLSVIVSYFWGERRVAYLIMVSIIFPLIVFVFFETILGLRFPPGIITNLYYG